MVIVFFAVDRAGESMDAPGQAASNAPSLSLSTERNGVKIRLWPGSKVHAGEKVSIEYVPRGARHGVILSSAGAGEVTVHFPRPEQSSLLESEDPQRVDPIAVPAQGDYLRFFFFSADRALDPAGLAQAVGQLGPGQSLELPGGVVEWSAHLER